MKKFITLLSFILVLVSASAQDLTELKKESRINVEFDYSEVLINGLDIDDFSDYERDWDKDEPKIYGKFLSNFNKKQKNIVGGHVKNAKFTLTVHPITITEKGDIKAYYTITDENGIECYKSTIVKASGGTFGSQLNLIGDGMEALGNKIGSQFKGLIK
ncbi:MAG: hypothetical protein NC453_11615 [Muribaculum sp.]|nr:hypothetical protein [Muribaculum sp.]